MQIGFLDIFDLWIDEKLIEQTMGIPIQSNKNKHYGKYHSGTNKVKLPKDLKILITEDEKAVDLYFSVVLRNIGREILHAVNGIEAVEICRKNDDIDLILMDIKMPEMNGYDATMEIRKFNKDVIIIAQTAYALIGDREKTIEVGCNDYITKPVKIDKLMEMLGKYFK
jgi:CheY-like chemotaxis protein